MIAQVQKDASSRTTMTILTIQSADRKSPQIVRSGAGRLPGSAVTST
jgi:hypothetical protein